MIKKGPFPGKTIACVYAFVSFLLFETKIHAQIIINEIMPANASMFLDPTYNYSGWVEFYNSGETEQSLYGYYLSDEPDKTAKTPDTGCECKRSCQRFPGILVRPQ